jgi:hypothetical protein
MPADGHGALIDAVRALQAVGRGNPLAGCCQSRIAVFGNQRRPSGAGTPLVRHVTSPRVTEGPSWMIE